MHWNLRILHTSIWVINNDAMNCAWACILYTNIILKLVPVMPVPVSVTHKKGSGLEAAQHAVLPTSSSLFDRLGSGSGAAVNKNVVVSEDTCKRSTPSEAVVQEDSDVPAVRTNDLNFWYCDIGTLSSIRLYKI